LISRIHSKLGSAGFIVAIVALVAALTGAAFAAGGLTAQQEKQVKKIAKKFAGKNGKDGAAGPQGPAGAAGAKGDTGAKGDKGDQGADGEDGTDGTDGEDGACSEANNECVMPAGSTTFGHWAFFLTGAGLGTSPISFTLEYPDPAGPTLHFVTAEEIEEEEVPAECSSGTEEGSVQNPIADPGNLCAFEETQNFTPYAFDEPTTNQFPPDAYGAQLYFGGEEFSAGLGTWAVTAPEAP
jgi:hypothetical protein